MHADHAARERWFESPQTWRFLALRFVPVLAALNLAWEIAQLPGYAIWTDGSPGYIAFAVAHCTAGDVLIGLATLAIALVLTRAGPIANPLTKIGDDDAPVRNQPLATASLKPAAFRMACKVEKRGFPPGERAR